MLKNWCGNFMKKTQFIELLKNIQGSLVSFISMTMFIALGLGIFAGITFSVKDLKNSAIKVQNENSFHDVELYFPYGIDDKDIEILDKLKGVDLIEGIFSTSVLGEYNSLNKIVKFQTISKKINTIYEIEGKLPAKDNEIVIDVVSAKSNHIEIGDKIKIIDDDASISAYIDALYSLDDEDIEGLSTLKNNSYTYLKYRTYTITGFVKTPVYNSKSGQTLGVSTTHAQLNDIIAFCLTEGLNIPKTKPYNYVYICNNDLRKYQSFSSDYNEALKEFVNDIKEEATILADKNFSVLDDKKENIINSSQEKLNDGKSQLEEGEKKLNEAVKQMEDGEYLIKTNSKKLADGKILLDDAKTQLDDAQNQIDVAENELISKTNELNHYVNRVDNYDATKANAKTALEVIINNTSLTDSQKEDAIKDTALNNDDFKVVMLVNLAPLLKDDIKFTDINITTPLEIAFSFINEVDLFIDNISSLNETEKESLKSDLNDKSKSLVKNVVVASGYRIVGDDSKFAYYMIKAATDLFYINDKLDDYTGYATSLEKFKDMYYEFGRLVDLTSTPISSLIGGFDYATYKTKALQRTNDLLSPLKRIIKDAWDTLETTQLKVDDGYSQYEEKLAEYNKALILLKQGENQIADVKKQIEEGETKLADAKIQYENGVNNLNEFKEQSSLLKNYGVSISLRSDNQSYTINNTTFDAMNKLKFSLGSLFIIIGTLVCYSVISRLVNDQIIRIGTKKAIGLYQKEILMSYMMYTGLALFFGFLLGCFVAYVVVQLILVNNLKTQMLAPVNDLYFSLKDILPVFAIQLFIMETATYMACNSMVKRNAIELLQGPKVAYSKRRFYESFQIWNKLSLLTKTIINNFVNDKRRVFATIVGIAGCTALIVSSLTFRNNVLKSLDVQFTNYYHFDTFITYSNDKAKEEIEKILDSHFISYLESNKVLTKIDIGEDISAIIYTYVYDGDYSKMMSFVSSDKSNPYNGEGVWLGESIKEYYNLDNQVEVKANTSSGLNISVVTSGFIRNHTQNNFMVMSSQTFEEVSGEKFSPNCLTVSLNGYDRSLLIEELSQINGFLSTINYYDSCSNIFNVFKLMANVMVAVYIVLSFLMAVFVIFNLISMYIAEKKKELIVLMINGFSLKQARRYIYSDTILLTIIGIILGCILGYVIGDYSITSLESQYIRFVHGIDITSLLVGIIFTSVMTFAVSLVSLKKIEKFKLTDISK